MISLIFAQFGSSSKTPSSKSLFILSNLTSVFAIILAVLGS